MALKKSLLIIVFCLFFTACSANNGLVSNGSEPSANASQAAPSAPPQSSAPRDETENVSVEPEPPAEPSQAAPDPPQEQTAPSAPQENAETEQRPEADGIDTTVTSVAAGEYSSFAVRSDGSLWGWGVFGEVEWGENIPPPTPIPMPEKIMEDVAEVAAGGWSGQDSPVFAIKTDSSLWAFGNNTTGQLGDGTTTSRSEPAKVMDDVAAVSVGAFHVMAIKQDGSLWAWGGNWQGELGDGSTEDRLVPVKIMDDVIAIAAGSSHSMAVTSDGVLWGWGHNGTGRLGYAATADELNPIHPNPLRIMEDVSEVSAGFDHTLVIKNDGSLWAFGNNAVGMLGVGPPVIPPEGPYHMTASPSPTPIKIMEDVVSASAGDRYSMAITSDGALWAWGDNQGWALLGLGDSGKEVSVVASPVKIMDGVAAVSAWSGHTLAVRTDGSVWAWGDNRFAQIGDGGEYGFLAADGGIESRSSPSLVAFSEN